MGASCLLALSWLNTANADVSFLEIKTDKGHDSFLLDVPEFKNTLQGYLENITKEAGIWAYDQQFSPGKKL